MIIKIIDELLYLTGCVIRQLKKQKLLEFKREVKAKEKSIENQKRYKQHLNEELLVVELKLKNLEIEKGELEKIVKEGV